MTQLELLFMKVTGLSEIETKDMIKILVSLDDLTKDKLNKVKLMLLAQDSGLLEKECNAAVELLMQIRDSR